MYVDVYGCTGGYIMSVCMSEHVTHAKSDAHGCAAGRVCSLLSAAVRVCPQEAGEEGGEGATQGECRWKRNTRDGSRCARLHADDRARTHTHSHNHSLTHTHTHTHTHSLTHPGGDAAPAAATATAAKKKKTKKKK